MHWRTWWDRLPLLLALLNPFLLIVYLADLFKKLDRSQFRRVLVGAGGITTVTFCCFAVLGDAIFSSVIHAEFASFQIFGGLIFVMVGIQFVFHGPGAIEQLRGGSTHVLGMVAMPVLIGPGTISASVVIGKRHEPLTACAVVVSAVVASLAILFLLKALHDWVRPRREPLIERYIEIAGRVSALYVGTVAVEMIFQGVRTWLGKM